MTVSFHESVVQCRGDITDNGVEKGEYYSLNAPLKNGLDDASFVNLLVPVIHKAMEVYQPEAIVLQCGPDSLAGDALGKFNLTIEGHGACLGYIRSFNVPLMLLGGQGHTLGNVARCWCYEVSLLTSTMCVCFFSYIRTSLVLEWCFFCGFLGADSSCGWKSN